VHLPFPVYPACRRSVSPAAYALICQRQTGAMSTINRASVTRHLPPSGFRRCLESNILETYLDRTQTGRHGASLADERKRCLSFHIDVFLSQKIRCLNAFGVIAEISVCAIIAVRVIAKPTRLGIPRLRTNASRAGNRNGTIRLPKLTIKAS